MNETNTILTTRKKVAFFDYPDVFEDFYPHYNVSQKDFANSWHNTANHAMVRIVQERVGDVTWYMLCIRPEFNERVRHSYTGCNVRYLHTSRIHRFLWRTFYYKLSDHWKRKYYRLYATLASYLAVFSWPLLRSLFRDRPDVIFCQEYCSGKFDVLRLLAWALRIPLITMHAGSTGNFMGTPLRKFTLPRTEWIFPSGDREKQFLAKCYQVPHERMSILRPPSDINVYRPMDRNEAAAEWDLPSDGTYFVFIGRLDDSMKRVSSIIKAFQSLAVEFHNAYLLIAGNGNDESALRALASVAYGERIRFLGWIADDITKKKLLNTADCMVMASRREGFPTVIGEAMACGTPVLAPDVGTIADLVINDKTGWLFSPLDDDAMLEKMRWVATHAKEIYRLRPSIREFAIEHISYASVTRQLLMGFDHSFKRKRA